MSAGQVGDVPMGPGGIRSGGAAVGRRGRGICDDFGVDVDADDAGGNVFDFIEKMRGGQGEVAGTASTVEDEKIARKPRDCSPWA